MPRDTPDTGIVVELPGREAGPFAKIGRRVLLALALIALVALVTYAGRDGYVDPEDDSISLLDAFYYSTVTITTTGYGDIRPVTDEARLVTTIIVTPARVLFLILLVGTTLEILAERSRQAYRRARWRRSLDSTRSSAATGPRGGPPIGTLLGKGATAGQIVVIDERSDARLGGQGGRLRGGDRRRQRPGDAASRPGSMRASSVVVAVDRDDAAVLVTLTARELNERATIVAAVREEENVHLLHQSGADSVDHLLGRRRAAARAVDRDAADHRAARGPAHRRRGPRHRRARGRARGGRARPRAAADATRCCSPSSATAS